jgi:hypothetical protein
MKAHIMNKNVEHNGKMYAKGSAIKESDEGFKEIVGKGHAQSIDLGEDGEMPKMQDEGSKWAHTVPQGSESEEQSSESAKPKGKSKK